MDRMSKEDEAKLKPNQRYVSYLAISDNPKMWEYIIFIQTMVNEYGKEFLKKEMVGSYRIFDHDNFTDYIKSQCKDRPIEILKKVRAPHPRIK